MPNKKAAMKSLKQDKKKNLRNSALKAELRTFSKDARVLIVDKKKDEADAALKKLESKLRRAAKNDIIKKENASRRISRLRSQWAKI